MSKEKLDKKVSTRRYKCEMCGKKRVLGSIAWSHDYDAATINYNCCKECSPQIMDVVSDFIRFYSSGKTLKEWANGGR